MTAARSSKLLVRTSTRAASPNGLKSGDCRTAYKPAHTSKPLTPHTYTTSYTINRSISLHWRALDSTSHLICLVTLHDTTYRLVAGVAFLLFLDILGI